MAQDNDMGNNPWHFDTDCTVDGAELRPVDDCNKPFGTTESVALLIHHVQRQPLSNAELSQLTGLSSRYVGDVLRKASRVVPLYKEAGRWEMVDDE